MFGSYEFISKSFPEVVVEIYDADFGRVKKNKNNNINKYQIYNNNFNKLYSKQDELMGRCYVKLDINNSQKKLEWYRLYLKNIQAGDILASFELTYASKNFDCNIINKEIVLPESILNNFQRLLSFKRKQIIPAVPVFKSKSYTLEVVFFFKYIF